MTVLASVLVAPWPAWRGRLLSVLASPFYATGWAIASISAAVLWCGTAFSLGLGAGRDRWRRAG